MNLWEGIKVSLKGKRYTIEFKKQVVEQTFSAGRTIAGTAKDFGIGNQTLRNWIRDSRDSKCPEKVRIAELEKENARLKKLAADLSLDNAILKDVNSKNF